MGLCSVLSLAACSVINHFDDVKPPAGGGGSSGAGSSTTSPTSAATGGTSATGVAGSGSGTAGNAGSSAGSSAGGGSSTGGGSGTGGSTGTGGTIKADSGAAGGAGTDAGVVDAPPDTSVAKVTCHFVIGSPTGGHVKLADYSTVTSPQRTLSDKFFAIPLTNNTSVRILAQLGGNPDTYLQYVASDSGMSGGAQSILSQGRLVDAQKLNSRQTAAMIIQQNNMGTSSPQLMVHTFDDGNFGASPVIAPMTNKDQLGTSGSIDARFAPDADGKIAVAASFEVAAGRTRAGYGLYTGTPVDLIPLLDDSNPDNVRPLALVHVRGSAGYTFIGETPQWVYEVKDSDPAMTPPAKRQIMGTSFVLLANPNSTGLLNFGAADFGTFQTPQLKLSVGQFDPARGSVLSLDPASFVVAKNATSRAEVPIASLNGFNGDYLYFIGPTGMAGTELSILFVDVLGRIRVEHKLMDTQGPVTKGVVTPRGNAAGAGGKYHIAWTEQHSDIMGNYDMLYYDQLDCL